MASSTPRRRSAAASKGGQKPKAATQRASRAGASGALAAGAARASGERARRRSTPLIQQQDGAPSSATSASPAPGTPSASPATGTPSASPATSPPSTQTPAPSTPPAASRKAAPQAPAQTRPRKLHRPQPVAKAVPSKKAVATSGARTTRPTRRTAVAPAGERPAPAVAQARPLKAVRGDGEVLRLPVPAPAPTTHVPLAPGIEELLKAGVAALRMAAESSGLSPEEVEHQVAETLSFLRRRLTGDYTVDEFGFDEDFTEHAYLPLLRPLYRKWFRVEVRGIENIPSEGGALVVANHSGTIAMDSLMTQVAVHDEHPAHRHLRMLGADLVFQTPVIGQMARRSGSTLAANPDAERLLSKGELAGVWPEGFKGVGKPFSERYKLQRFGRGGFVSAALRTGVPIVPCSIVGAEEIYPIIGNMRTVARLVGAPYAPITPTWPLLGPLGLVPLPSKWIIEFGSPVETAHLGEGAADDPMLVFDLTDQVRETIQQTLYSLLMQRRSVFF